MSICLQYPLVSGYESNNASQNTKYDAQEI